MPRRNNRWQRMDPRERQAWQRILSERPADKDPAPSKRRTRKSTRKDYPEDDG